MNEETGIENDEELTLEVVRKHIRQWRSKLSRPKKFPEWLWKEAASLVGPLSVSQVRKALNLNYRRLKEKAVEMGKITMEAENKAPIFVETRVEEIMGQSSNAVEGWHLAVERADGSRLLIQPPSFDDRRMLAMIKDFAGV